MTTDEQLAASETARITLEAENKELENQLAETTRKHEADQSEAAQVVNDLKQQLASEEKKTAKLPLLKLGKDTYELFGGDFTYKGQTVTVAILKDNKELLQHLVDEGFGNLRKLEK